MSLYMQLDLAEESRKLTTFYTYCGRKRFKTLRLRVNSAVEVRKIVSLEPLYDDVLIFGATREEHVSYNYGGVTD